jgi:hypothetical protein
MGSPPRAPQPAPAPKLPSPADPAIEEAAKRKRQAELNARGRKSTILTGITGVEDATTKKTLLGA